MANDLSTSIDTAAQGPAQVSVDGRSAQQQPLPDLIEADRYLKTVGAVANTKRRGLIITPMRPPGAV
ncbi:MAG: hypothetical protein EXS05_03840 [Planctomycetaceae bacterium]|nr:hypothetical protein [Planctomycetaceae bacterium]